MAKTICDALENEGYRAYAVGGCVRDAVMGITPHDTDITTSATPAEVKRIFELLDFCVIETGLKHGTVTVVCDKIPYEITTMRTEQGYTDMRHPEKVCFVRKIEEDLSRRDFTVNAMAYSYTDRCIVDLHGGMKDIEKRVIRCVGEPKQRFCEDALRILRALRFASSLGFSIDDGTAQAMRECSMNIRSVSAERIFKELTLLLCGKNAGRVIYEYSDILSIIIPELELCKGFDQHSRYHCYDVLRHICEVVDNIPAIPHLRFAAFLHDVGKPSVFSLDDTGEGHFYAHAQASTRIARRLMDELKADGETKKKTLFLVKHHDAPLPQEDKLIKKRLGRIGADAFFELIEIAKADCKGQSPRAFGRLDTYRELEHKVNDIIDSGACFTRASLAVDGNDIISLGVSEGREIGEILSQLLSAVMEGNVENNKEDLLCYARRLLQ